MKKVLATLGVLALAQLTGHLVGCGFLKQEMNNPADDVALSNCLLHERVDFGLNHDAGGALGIYNACTVDGGFR